MWGWCGSICFVTSTSRKRFKATSCDFTTKRSLDSFLINTILSPSHTDKHSLTRTGRLRDGCDETFSSFTAMYNATASAWHCNSTPSDEVLGYLWLCKMLILFPQILVMKLGVKTCPMLIADPPASPNSNTDPLRPTQGHCKVVLEMRENSIYSSLVLFLFHHPDSQTCQNDPLTPKIVRVYQVHRFTNLAVSQLFVLVLVDWWISEEFFCCASMQKDKAGFLWALWSVWFCTESWISLSADQYTAEWACRLIISTHHSILFIFFAAQSK